MVAYIKSDLEFILKQIKIAEADAAYREGVSTGDPSNPGKPLFGEGGSIPSYNISWGLRTVDGSYNHLLPGQEQWGAADRPFQELMEPEFRTVMVDPDGPGGSPAIPITYTPGADADGPGTQAGPGDVIDPQPRTISNLIVDQTLGNPAAILTALQRAGIDDPGFAITNSILAAYQPLKPLFQAVAVAERADASAAAAAAANPGNTTLQQAAADAAAVLATARADLDAQDDALVVLLDAHSIEMDGANVHLPNVAPDEGLSAPFNSWFTLFGQFFDHGLDLVNKGDSGTVMIPLLPDDPLYVPGSTTNFMVLTRATVSAGEDGTWGTADDVRPVNTTTPFVDQNQTYTSHPSHQAFIRQYVSTPDGPVATGKLIEGSNGGMANWGEVKAQAANILGIQLTDLDVGKVPLLRTDPYGNFIPGDNGFPQLITGIGPDGIPNTNDDTVVEGDPQNPVDPTVVGAIRTNHAFLADIAHTAVPDGTADGDTEIGGNIPQDGVYDNELLDAHFIAGDGRANENVGLTAVHHVFHAEHNRLVEHTQSVVVADALAMLANGATQAEAVAFLNEWLVVDVASVPPNTEAGIASVVWDGERLFQAAKFGTEMQYQHLVFEEFARKVQPTINTFLVPDGFDTTMDPSIFAEFAHVVYRFGHSMLTESIDQFSPTFQPNHISLIQGFLNPTAFTGPGGTIEDEVAAGAIIRGMTRQVGNEIDEFVTSALRNNLLGLPLDLATINLARGRDAGVPSLNEARRTFYEATNEDVRLKPYESWVDYAGHLKHEASIINFIAAYGTHALIEAEATIEGKRAAALAIILGTPQGVDDNGDGVDDRTIAAPADALDFLNGTGAYTADLGGLENVDLWIGGLAEEVMPFGGMLGATFNFVFEVQMELLQSGDRFYYLQRLDGLHLFGEMENNSFAAMIMRNTNATHLPSDVFSTPGLILEVDSTRQFNDLDGDGTLESTDPLGGGILTPLVVRNDPSTAGPDTNYLRYTGEEHVVLGGTEAADTIIAGIGDDTLFGDGGNDKLEGGFGNDIINGGDGDDIIKDAGGDDNIKAGAGNDVVHAGPGLDLVLGGAGQDFIFLGTDEGSEVFAGEGNDFIYGNKNAERILGNEGDDWIETGTFDGAPGDNFDEIFAHDGIDGHDVFLGDGGFDEFIGEGGDDIMVGSAGRGKMVGMSGWDWATYKDSTLGVDADLSRPIIFDEAPTIPGNAALDEYQSMEGLSGSAHNDILKGSNVLADERLPADPNADPQGGLEGYTGSALDADGVALINGLDVVVGSLVNSTTSYSAGDIILGGDGSDTISGLAGDDIIDGDKWLDVQIGVFAPGDTNHTGTPTALHDSMTTLSAAMSAGTINPGQLAIVRSIKTADGVGEVDTAVFSDDLANYDITQNSDGTVTVAHARGTQTDGTDTLRNIERLLFAGNQEVFLATPATGQPVIGDVTPTQGQALTVDTSGIADLNGLGAFSYQWQRLNGVTWTDIPGATAATFAPGSTEVNLQIRVVVSFTDGNGNPEQVISAATGIVGSLLTGSGVVDNFVGGDGDDNASGAGGADNLQGNGGDDILSGGAGNDTLSGGVGNDTMSGGAGLDTMAGGDGNDIMAGGGGNDVMTGGDGNDTMNGGVGTDTMTGGQGSDTMTGGDGGNDLAVFSGPLSNYGIALNGSSMVVTDSVGTDGVDTLTGFERLRFGGVTYTVVQGTNAGEPLTSAAGTQLVLGFDGDDTITAGAGNDAILAGAGDDTIVWTAALPFSGSDYVDGGTEGAVGDTFQISGAAAAETFRIYTRNEAVAQIGYTGSAEIVVTRAVGANPATIIAQLSEIEEILVNAATASPPGGPVNGTIGGDTIEVFGDFTETSLRFDTITIDGNIGDDTIDISSLTSAHRIVFRSNGGHDTIIGNLRPDDVIALPAGTSLADYTSSTTNGVTTLTNGTHSISYTAAGGAPQIVGDEAGPVDEEPTDEENPTPTSTMAGIVGTVGADPLFGTSAGEGIMGLAGRDVIFARGGDDDVLGGDDADMIYGDAGNDRLLGDNGDDFLNGGAGSDTVFGGNGSDLIVAEAGDGDDTYYGDDMVGGAGTDTLDMSAITANITADLGTGFMGRGSVSSSQTGSDTIWGIEHIATGSGSDVITASSSTNIMDGGAGNDIYRFRSAADANGDTIASFQPGDKIDLSPMDAMADAGNQSFTLVTGSAFTGAGQVLVTHESRADGDYTVIQGNADGDDAAEFSVSVKGNHELKTNDFNL